MELVALPTRKLGALWIIGALTGGALCVLSGIVPLQLFGGLLMLTGLVSPLVYSNMRHFDQSIHASKYRSSQVSDPVEPLPGVRAGLIPAPGSQDKLLANAGGVVGIPEFRVKQARVVLADATFLAATIRFALEKESNSDLLYRPEWQRATEWTELALRDIGNLLFQMERMQWDPAATDHMSKVFERELEIHHTVFKQVYSALQETMPTSDLRRQVKRDRSRVRQATPASAVDV